MFQYLVNRFVRTSMRNQALVIGLVLGVQACGAPPSERATGPVAEAIEASIASGTEPFDHSTWDRLLGGGTRDGLVDYRFFQAHESELNEYLAQLAEADAARLAPSHLEALLINAYNALTIRAILDHPSVTSIRQIDGVWTRLRFPVAGHRLTLDEIEHNLLRPFFRDPRIHFAVNCASLSCAPLPPWAFDGAVLDAQLEERTRAFLTNSENARLEDGLLFLSRYFDWYAEDFVSEGWNPRAATVSLFVARYAGSEVAEAIERGGTTSIRFTEYDWSLNALQPPALDRGGADDAAEGGIASWLRDRVSGFGTAGPLIYGIAYVLGVVLFLPGAALTIGAGIAFGLGKGTVLVSLASTTGAALAFLIARYLLRTRVEGWVAGHDRFAAVDRAVESQGWKVVALTRLSPAFPFNLQNYAYGLTGVSFTHYVLASWIAMLPGTLLYVSIGVTGVELASAATGAAGWGATLLRILGFVATVAVVVLVAAAARRELRAVVAEVDPRPVAAVDSSSEAAGV